MPVVVDTPVWSLFVRRAQANPEMGRHLAELRRLVAAGDAVLIGPVRQELLSGIRDQDQFIALRTRLRGFLDVPLTVSDYERAAEFANTCAAAGVQGSPVDMLVCAVAERSAAPIFTLDADFTNYRRILPISLHSGP